MSTLILTCERCGQKNRVPAARLAQAPVCGKCRHGVTPQAPLDVDGSTLEGLVRESGLPVLVDFFAHWCGPCRTVAPVIAQLAKARAGQLLVLKVNVDEAPEAGARHQVSGIPALLLFSGGRECKRLVGAQPRAAIEAAIDRCLRGGDGSTAATARA